MSVTLTVYEGKPALELTDHKGECWKYTFEVTNNSERLFSLKLRKCDGDEEPEYLVQIGQQWCSCDCPDYRMRKRKAGLHCKHLAATASMRELLSALTPEGIAHARSTSDC